MSYNCLTQPSYKRRLIVEEAFCFPNSPCTSSSRCLLGLEISLVRAWFYTFWVSWTLPSSIFLVSWLLVEGKWRVFRETHLPPALLNFEDSASTMAQTCCKTCSRYLSLRPTNFLLLASWQPNVFSSSHSHYYCHYSCCEGKKARHLLEL